MIETNVGGNDAVVISPWRHFRDSGSIALDMGVHYIDIFSYYHGELERVFGSAFVAEPFRLLAPGAPPITGIEEVSPGVMRATGEDSLVALYETASGVLVQLHLPSLGSRAPVDPAQRARPPRVDERPARSLGWSRRRSARRSDAERGRAAEGARRLRARRSGRLVLRPGGNRVRPPLRRGRRGDDRYRARRLRRRRLPSAGPRRSTGLAGLRAVAGVWAVAESRELARLPCASPKSPMGRCRSPRSPLTWRSGSFGDKIGDAAMSETHPQLLAPPFKQCAVVVEDLDEAVRRWARALGDRPLDRLPARAAPAQGDALPRRRGGVLPPPRARLAGRAPVRAGAAARVGRASSPTTSRPTARVCTTSASTCRTTRQAVAEALGRRIHAAAERQGLRRRGRRRLRLLPSRPACPMIIELISAPRVRIEPEFVYYPPRLLTERTHARHGPTADRLVARSDEIMRIASVEAIPAGSACYVRVVGDDGTSGVGESTFFGWPTAVAEIVRSFGPSLKDATPSTWSTTGSPLPRPQLSGHGRDRGHQRRRPGAVGPEGQALRGARLAAPGRPGPPGGPRHEGARRRALDRGAGRLRAPSRRGGGLQRAEDPALPERAPR